MLPVFATHGCVYQILMRNDSAVAVECWSVRLIQELMGFPTTSFFLCKMRQSQTRSALPNISRVIKLSTITERFDSRLYSLIYIFVSVQKSQGQYLFHTVQDSVTNAACFRGLLLWKSSVFLKKKNLPSWAHYPGFKCTLQLL